MTVDTTKEKFYGRMRGRNISDRRLNLLDELLPAIAVPSIADDYSSTAEPLNIQGLFPDNNGEFNGKPIWMEIGFGGGEHLADQAIMHPDINMIGCEPFINGVANVLSIIDQKEINNVRLWQYDARPLLDRMDDACLDRMFILFNDPWPKKRHHERRFIPANLDRVARVMKPGSELRLAHDHMEYLGWMLHHTMNHPAFEWNAESANDWRIRPDDWPATRYEQKALRQGRKSLYLSFTRV